MTSATTFGEYFKELRIRCGKTLRQFCVEHDYDPGNISRLERGRMAPPEDRVKLEEYAKRLGLRPQTDDWARFFDLAAMEKGRIPADILNDRLALQKLPLLFRTARGKDLTKDQLKMLMREN